MDDRFSTCSVADVAVDIKTETDYERDRADELNDEAEIIEDFVAEVGPDDVVLDVGANVGLYSLFAAARGATAIAVEPYPANLDSLHVNIEQNDLEVTVIEGALTEEAGEKELYVAAEEAGAGTHTFAPNQVSEMTITVPTFTADGLIEAGTIPKPTIAKLDVQGSEYLVLDGMRETLADTQLRTIYCELHPEQVERIGGSAEAVESLLETAGFDLEMLVDKADVTWNIKATR